MLQGLYVPGDSIVHRLDARAKILLAVSYAAALFTAASLAAYGLILLGLIVASRLARIRFTLLGRGLKGFLPLIIFTSALCALFTPGETWWRTGVPAWSLEGLQAGLRAALGFSLFISGSTLFTYTTSPLSLLEGLNRLLGPLRHVGLDGREIALVLSIAWRFVPVILEEAGTILNAQKARGAAWDSGSPTRRLSAAAAVFTPLFLRAWHRADTLSAAMICRGYRGGGRAWPRAPLSPRDYAALVLAACWPALIAAL
jgi:energy-coupling factor transport system permease protein